MENKIKIGLIEDQFLFREGIKSLINSWNGLEVVFECADGFSVLKKLEALHELPDVIIVDFSLPSNDGKEFNGLSVIKTVGERYPSLKFLMLSIHKDEKFISHMIEQGARGHLSKEINPEELKTAIFNIYQQGSYINEQTLKAIQRSLGKSPKQSLTITDQISKREKEVLQLICKQHTTEEIAEILFISVTTVNGHRNNLLQKTNSKNIAGLVIYAIKNLMVKLD